MTVAFIGGLNYFSRNASVPSAGAHTFTCWIKPTVGGAGSLRTFYGRSGNTEQWGLGLDTNDLAFFWTASGQVVRLQGTTTITGGTWWFIALTQDASNNFALYVGNESTAAAADASANGAWAPVDNDVLRIGSDRWSGYGCPCDFAYARVWTVALTGAQVEAERLKKSAVVTSGLWAEYDFTDNTDPSPDASGNSRTLTKGGTVNNGGTGPSGLTEPGALAYLPALGLLPNVLLRR